MWRTGLFKPYWYFMAHAGKDVSSFGTQRSWVRIPSPRLLGRGNPGGLFRSLGFFFLQRSDLSAGLIALQDQPCAFLWIFGHKEAFSLFVLLVFFPLLKHLGTGCFSFVLFPLGFRHFWGFWAQDSFPPICSPWESKHNGITFLRIIYCAQNHPRSEESGEYVSRNQSSLPKLAQPRRFKQILRRTILVKAFHVPKLLQLIKWRQLTYPLWSFLNHGERNLNAVDIHSLIIMTISFHFFH